MKIEKTFDLPNVAEMQARKDKVMAEMAVQGYDAVVIFDPDNVFWLTQFANFVHERPFILVMDKQGTLNFVVPKIESTHVNSRKVGEVNLIEYIEFPAAIGQDWKTIFTQTVADYSRVGFEENAPYFVVEALGQRGSVTPIVEEARFTKSPYELARINYACELANETFEELLALAKPGLGAMESNKILTSSFMSKIYTNDPMTNYLATRVGVVVQSPNVSHDPHNYTNFMAMDMVEGGPHVAVVNSVVNGYGTEVERTFFLGHVPENCVKPYEVMMEARAIAFDLCKPGESMHDVDAAVYQHLCKHGYGDNFLHRTGHGIGVTGHEGPFLAMGYDRVIEPNMVFTIEPAIYIPGIGGFRHSDTIITSDSGIINLTPIRDSLADLTL
ncbi:MAG: M24 family metallopeptidase [Glaciecola sp.]|jgi:Xaa-Pro dipeptidase